VRDRHAATCAWVAAAALTTVRAPAGKVPSPLRALPSRQAEDGARQVSTCVSITLAACTRTRMRPSSSPVAELD